MLIPMGYPAGAAVDNSPQYYISTLACSPHSCADSTLPLGSSQVESSIKQAICMAISTLLISSLRTPNA